MRYMEANKQTMTMHRNKCQVFLGWFALLLLMCADLVWCHARLVCPPPRSPDTGAKFGPCGHEDDPTMEAFALEPGLQTIVWEESIYHFAAPARLALSYGGDDADSFEGCVLLDHIPHGDTGLPKNMSFTDESTVRSLAFELLLPFTATSLAILIEI